MARRLAAVLAAVGCLLIGAPAAAVAPSDEGFHYYDDTAALEGTAPVADISSGFDVTVVPDTPHAARIVPAVQTAVAQLRSHGIDVRYEGLAAAPVVNGAPAYGTIGVTEATGADPAVCRRDDYADAGLVTEGVTYPSLQNLGVVSRVNSAAVTLCPALWSHDAGYVTAIVLHEMGHAVGLGHYRQRYRGHVQVMNPDVPDVQTYQDGDVNGLQAIAANTAQLQSQSRLRGDVESWRVRPGGLLVTGWALVGITAQFADVTVTADGKAVYQITTSTPRPDIVTAYRALWPNPGFAGSQIPMTDGTHTYCVVASDPTRPTTRLTLGCRDLSFPPPTASPAPSSAPAAIMARPGDHVGELVALAAAVVVGLLLAGLALRGRRR